MRKRVLSAAILSLVVAAHADEWQVDKKGENQVEFISTVIGFSFEGKTDAIDGFIYWEGEELFEKNDQFLFEIELNTLETGIGKRDRDLLENFLIQHYKVMPRTMLRYAIEKLPEADRQAYLRGEK